MTGSKILNPEWFYDELQNTLQENLKLTEDNLSDWKKRKMQSEKHPQAKDTMIEYNGERKSFGEVVENGITLRENKLRVDGFTKGEIKEAKPFLMGGATLESLINVVPEDYSCVREGRLPFDNIFFEFDEPQTLKMPLIEKEAEFRAMRVSKTKCKNVDFTHINDRDLNGYIINAYFKEQSKIYSLNLYFTPETEGNLDGDIGELVDNSRTDKNLEIILFSIDKKNGSLRLSKGKDNKEEIAAYQYILLNWDGKTEKPKEPKYEIEMPLNEAKGEYEFIAKLPNLTTNIVNYINAHNVTVVKREREIIELTRDERNKKKKKVSKQPFYIITVQDKVYYEPDTPREVGQWTLEWRVFVRGHWKYYRDEKGQKISENHRYWTSPHMRGPEGAPFRETRYQVLHDKLKREQEMMKKYGVHQYSPDLTMPGSSQKQNGGNR